MSAQTFASWFGRLCLIALLGAMGLRAAATPARAQTDTALQAVAQINQMRLENGLTPLSISAALERAAQRHSDDQQRGNFLDDTGSDGSTGSERIAVAGFGAWSGNRLIWGETLYVSTNGFAETLDFILNDPVQRNNLLNTRFREVGVAVAGTDRQYWTVLYGAQPNVLPAFINDGAGVTNDANVAVRVGQEEAMPSGDGNTVIGTVLEVRASSNPNFTGVAWQTWKPLLEARFDLKPGPKTIYVQYRDGAGRMTTSAASIRYDPNATNTYKPFGPGAVMTDVPATASASASATIAVAAIATATATSAPAPTTRAGEPAATSTAVQIGNAPPIPTATPAPVPILATAGAPAQPTAFVININGDSGAIPASNALPIATDAAVAADVLGDDTPQSAVIATATSEPASESSNEPTNPNALDRFAIARTLETPVVAWVLPVYLVLQALAIVVGLMLLFRKR